MRNQIIIAVAAIALAAGSGYAIKAHKDSTRAAERSAFVSECQTKLANLKAGDRSADWVYDCVYRGAVSTAEVTEVADAIRAGDRN